ncbi:hypothetical protein Taro_015234 [Colocasia esculenta]|uniref:Methyltransferase-like protein 2 n=1 Tax=Colocasia esculenta TaxID=4460 RepID=A0A843ULM6_COLES|nr:hypothetical protein [Colocasia esculenta]
MGAAAAASEEVSFFLETGVYRLLADSGAVFMDPVRVLGESYTRHSLRPSFYYSRSFPSSDKAAAAGGGGGDERGSGSSGASRKRKRKKKKKKKGDPRELSERERAAERRHQEARPILLKAHESFLRATELLSALSDMIQDGQMAEVEEESPEVNFIELGSLLQASQCELSLCSQGTQSGSGICCGGMVSALFDNSVCNETDDDLEAVFLRNKYIIPKRSCFYMSILYLFTFNACFSLTNFMKRKSDLRQIRNLIPAHSDYGFNFIVVDPPWENASASQKSLYPTLPSRHFLYIPVRQFAHTQGALVALWVTNREKLRAFIEEELFPAWGVASSTAFYWLKVKADGSMLCDLDLFHHRPYECLLLGYVNGKEVDTGRDTTYRLPQNNHIIVTMPSAYSRKPPLGNYIPGPKPARCIELFARELISGWTSWGNEPLHFQDSRYFIDKIT